MRAAGRRRRLAAIGVLALCWLASSPVTASALSTVPRDLALRFQPHLHFDTAEPWRPIDVDGFLAEPGHQVCAPGPSPTRCVPLTAPAQVAPPAEYLDLRGTRTDGATGFAGTGDASAPDLATCARSLPTLLDCDLGGRSAIYAHVTRSAKRIAIDYWWFLRYNAFLIDVHEGDWEGVTVVANAAGTRVLDVHFAAHSGVFRYRKGVAAFDGERHVRVYLAAGSHAAYPKRCTSVACDQTMSPFPEARFDGRSPWVANDPAACARRCVRLLPEARGAPASWNAWHGLWGLPASEIFPPPTTPAFQRRYLRPFDATLSTRRRFRALSG
jgi:hypothetical protein